MSQLDDTATVDVPDNLAYGQAIYDNAGVKVGTVDEIDPVTGWLKAEINPFSDKALYIPFRLIRNIDPREVYLSRSKDELRRDYADPPARETHAETIGGETVATTREASGYGGGSVVVGDANIDALRGRISEGYLVTTSDALDLGTVQRYDRVSGWMLIGKSRQTKNDLLMPVTLVSHVDREFAEVNLAVSRADLLRMRHLEPVDVVFANAKPR